MTTAPPKPGYLSSEFWVAVASQVMAFLSAMGWIAPGDRSTLEGAVIAAVTAGFALASSAWVIVRYVQSRTALKTHVVTMESRRAEPPYSLS